MYDRVRTAKALIQRADDINAGVKALEEARSELERLESVRRQYMGLQERRNVLVSSINQEKASLESEIHELARRIREDLEPAAKLAETTTQQLNDLADAEKRLTAEQENINRQSEELSQLSASIAAGNSGLERCVAEGRELRVKQTEMSTAGGPDALCPLCRTPLSEDACTNIAEWYEAEIAAKLTEHRELKHRIENLTEKRDKLSEETDQRGRALTQQQRQTQRERGRLEQQQRQIDAARELLVSLEPRLDGMHAALRDEEFASAQRQELWEVDAAIFKIAFDDASRQAAYESTQSLRHWDAEKLALETATARLPEDESEIERGEERVGTLRRHLEEAERDLEADRAALSGLPEAEKASSDADATQARLQRERDELLARQGRLQGDAERMRGYQSEIDQLEKSHRDAQTEHIIYSDLFGAFGRSGVPAMLIDAAVPHVENEANHLLGRMTDNRMAIKLETQRVNQGGNTVETLDILVSDELGSRNYELFSGGEAFRINLSLRIALSKVLSQRLGAPLPTLFIDEGFGTQDAAGRERIVDAIASIQDEFEKIIVITHLDDLKDLFPTRIEVLKTEAGSQFWLS